MKTKDELVRWCADNIQTHSKALLYWIDLLAAVRLMPEQDDELGESKDDDSADS